MKLTKAKARKRIQGRIKRKIRGTAHKPRLSVYKSNKGIYCQLIDDTSAMTLASANSKNGAVKPDMSKTEQAKIVGQIIAEKAKAQNITDVTFDRGGYQYHGRVKAVAEGAREGGLKF